MRVKETVQVEDIMPTMQGTTKNGQPWSKQGFVVKTFERYSRVIYLEAWNEAIVPLTRGQVIDVEGYVQSREYNGRYYTEVRATRITPVQQTQQQPNYI